MSTTRQSASERQLARFGTEARDTHNDPFTAKPTTAVPSATERQMARAQAVADRAERRARQRAHRARVLAEETETDV